MTSQISRENIDSLISNIGLSSHRENFKSCIFFTYYTCNDIYQDVFQMDQGFNIKNNYTVVQENGQFPL